MAGAANANGGIAVGPHATILQGSGGWWLRVALQHMLLLLRAVGCAVALHVEHPARRLLILRDVIHLFVLAGNGS